MKFSAFNKRCGKARPEADRLLMESGTQFLSECLQFAFISGMRNDLAQGVDAIIKASVGHGIIVRVRDALLSCQYRNNRIEV